MREKLIAIIKRNDITSWETAHSICRHIIKLIESISGELKDIDKDTAFMADMIYFRSLGENENAFDVKPVSGGSYRVAIIFPHNNLSKFKIKLHKRTKKELYDIENFDKMFKE